MRELKSTLPEYITHTLSKEMWSPTIAHTQYAGHATELARSYAEAGYDAVVAVGGDGTINEVARGLRDTSTAMGILPMGSGNGLARHLAIPMDIYQAVELLNHCETKRLDYGLANDQLFMSTCGAGFDAMVANSFAGSKQRGVISYLKIILRLVFTYRPQSYHLTGDQVDVSAKAFLITFANANQWGNAAQIAPKADLQDGLMDIMMMSPYALWGWLPLSVRLFRGNIDESPLMRTFRASRIVLHNDTTLPFHIDGDPIMMEGDVTIRIIKGGLCVLINV